MADSTRKSELVIVDDHPDRLPIIDGELALIQEYLGDIVADTQSFVRLCVHGTHRAENSHQPLPRDESE